ncbi:hypothetical protein ONS96_009633 [Cadophora gregata f. sp. sojae]|nr:hypothetical protein ONS96_009633 [Cadophora gregata f. sp. sojae]
MIDAKCIEFLRPDEASAPYDDMHILAFEADYPITSRKYIDGYEGFSWIRLDQLAYNFYELRLKADKIGMDQIWKAAQISRNQAFVSMKPEEALTWTGSSSMTGFTPDSVIGKRWYEIRDKTRGTEVPGANSTSDVA